MNDRDLLQRELEAIINLECNRITKARRVVQAVRWGMAVASIGLLLLSALVFRGIKSPWIGGAVSLFFGLVGYSFGRLDKWMVGRAHAVQVTTPQEAATQPVDWL